MGRKSRRTISKIEKRVIKQLGVDITYERMLADNDTDAVDRYGEPVERSADGITDSDYANKDSRIVRIVVESLKLDDRLTSIGGISNSGKEVLKCFISQSEDVKIGDRIYFPPDSAIIYEIQEIYPNYLQDDNIVYQVYAFRDPTTK